MGIIKQLGMAAAVGICLTAGAGATQAANETLSLGQGLVCDTAEEVEAVVKPDHKDIAKSVDAVNRRFGKDACNVLTAAFYRGRDAKAVLAPEGVIRVVEVKVVGVKAGEAWLSLTEPKQQYVAILDEATSV